MARLNVYVPDPLAESARRAGLNVSALTQAAIAEALARQATDAWLASLGTEEREVDEDVVRAAVDAAKDELGA